MAGSMRNAAVVGVVGIGAALLVFTLRQRASEPTSDAGEAPSVPPDLVAAVEATRAPVAVAVPEESRTIEAPPVLAPEPSAELAPETAAQVYDEAAWQAEMAAKPLEELMALEKRLDAEMYEKSQPEFQKYFDAGIHEYLGHEPSFSPTDSQMKTVFAVFMQKDRGTFLVTLPESDYPELYRLKTQRQWLARHRNERESAAMSKR